MQKTLYFLRVSLKNCGASNWEPKKSLKLGPFQKTSYFAMRFKGTPKMLFFPKPWSSESDADGAVELFFNSEPEICHFKTHFQISSELHGFLPDKIPTNVILRTVGPKLREKMHFKG